MQDLFEYKFLTVVFDGVINNKLTRYLISFILFSGNDS
jgi:hypothetical protein